MGESTELDLLGAVDELDDQADRAQVMQTGQEGAVGTKVLTVMSANRKRTGSTHTTVSTVADLLGHPDVVARHEADQVWDWIMTEGSLNVDCLFTGRFTEC